MAVRDSFGRFLGAGGVIAESAPPPAEREPEPDLAAAIAAAEQALAEHRMATAPLAQVVRDLGAERRELLAAGKIDEALHLDGALHEVRTTLESANERDQRLMQEVAYARENLRLAQARQLQPQIDQAYRELCRDAFRLIETAGRVRALELRAVDLGLIAAPSVPGWEGIFPYSLAKWSRRHAAEHGLIDRAQPVAA